MSPIANADRDTLRARLMNVNRTTLVDAVIDALAAAGGSSEWHSDTIESVLSPFEKVIAEVQMPWVGNSGESIESINAWRRVSPDLWDELCPICGNEGCDGADD